MTVWTTVGEFAGDEQYMGMGIQYGLFRLFVQLFQGHTVCADTCS